MAAIVIGIIDYGMGNLRSVQKAFEKAGACARILQRSDEVAACGGLVLPGVGAFADGMRHLVRGGWDTAVREFAGSGRPFLGICLGMQLMFEASEEGAQGPGQLVPGLGMLSGQVVAFTGPEFGPENLKVPHMGWNAVSWTRQDPVFEGIQPPIHVYFVHGFHAKADPATGDGAAVCGVSDYGGPLCASVWRGNLWGTQFHPEKSQRVGLRMLENFSRLVAGGGR